MTVNALRKSSSDDEVISKTKCKIEIIILGYHIGKIFDQDVEEATGQWGEEEGGGWRWGKGGEEKGRRSAGQGQDREQGQLHRGRSSQQVCFAKLLDLSACVLKLLVLGNDQT